MNLSKIKVINVRNIRDAVVNPGPNLNIILGDNGSGKSSFLESIYLLGRADSFRTHRNLEIINSETNQLSVFGVLKLSNESENVIGVNIGNKKRTIKINGGEVNSRVELINYFPLQIVTPLSYLLIEGSPSVRRQFLDWGLFHSEKNYPDEWKRFKRCLTQRNSALKIGKESYNGIWDVEIVKYGTIIARRRQEYLIQLKPFIANFAEQMLPSMQVDIEYAPGWDSNIELASALRNDFKKDLKFGYTHSGPHKGDLFFRINGRFCKTYLSRGQIKILVLVLKLAQIKLQNEKTQNFGSLMIDDFCSELDLKNTNNLKQFLSDLKLQCFITAMDRSSVGNLCGIDSTLFHVEQGRINKI